MQQTKLTVPLPPTLNSMYRTVRGRVYKIPKVQAYIDEIYWLWKAHTKMPPTDAPVSLSLTMYLKRDRDIDSSLKVLLDALQGKLYLNDSQVVELTIKKCIDKVNPRLEIEYRIVP